MRASAAAVLLLVALSGCSNEKKPIERITVPGPKPVPGTKAEPLTATELCALRVGFAVNDGAMCRAGHLEDARAIPEERLAELCRPGTDYRKWADRLLEAEAAGRLSIDWKKAHACIDQSRKLRAEKSGLELMSSQTWAELQAGACGTFYAGKIAEGAKCEDDWDCADRSNGCFTSTPTVEGSRVCARYATEGETCGWYTLCGEGLFCNELDTCAPLLEDFAPCNAHGECLSGFCAEGETGSFCAATATKALGEECVRTQECVGWTEGCLSCRNDGAGKLTCQTVGGEGSACTSRADCAWDLGCTAGICTRVGEGQPCGGETENLCAVGLSCVPTVDCAAFFDDEAACAATDGCEVIRDNFGWVCVSSASQCMTLPSSGPCVGAGACAEGAFCDRKTKTCGPRAQKGQSCTPTWAEDPKPCLESLVCMNDRCVAQCASDLDCPNGQVCDRTDNEDVPPVCVPKRTENCEHSAQCGEGKYCLHPVDICTGLFNETSCEAAAECDWDPFTACYNANNCDLYDAETCAQFPGECLLQDAEVCQDKVACNQLAEQSACAAAPECLWDSTFGFCDTACRAHEDEASCNGASGCSWDPIGFCASGCSRITDEASCTATSACEFVSTQLCSSKVDCTVVSDRVSCEANTACFFHDARCAVAPTAQTTLCAPRLAPGEQVVGFCQVGQDVGVMTGFGTSEACSSGACIIEGEGQPGICVERTNYGTCIGDDATGMVLSFSFLFGLVLYGRRRSSG